jgi:hypothetical protein
VQEACGQCDTSAQCLLLDQWCAALMSTHAQLPDTCDKASMLTSIDSVEA